MTPLCLHSQLYMYFIINKELFTIYYQEYAAQVLKYAIAHVSPET